MLTMPTKTKIEDAKNQHKLDMDNWDKQIKEYYVHHGNTPSDYLTFRIAQYFYHRGAYNALNELQKQLSKMGR